MEEVKTKIIERERGNLDSALREYLKQRIWCDECLMEHNYMNEIDMTIERVMERCADELHQKAFELISENIVLDESVTDKERYAEQMVDGLYDVVGDIDEFINICNN